MARGRRRKQTGCMPNPVEYQEEQNSNHSLPQPPPNWPHNSALNYQSRESLEPNNGEQDNDNLDESGIGDLEEIQTRGPTIMRSGWGLNGTILEITVNEIGQPIGESAAKLSSQLGALARNGILAPLNYKDWRLVPKLYKDEIWKQIKENTNATDDIRTIIMMSFGKKWKEWKHEIKQEGYDPYLNDAAHLAHRPDRVEENQWRALIYYWNSEEAKEKSTRNKCSRSKVTMPHTSGRKSHAQVRNEMALKKGSQPTRMEVFKATRTRKDDKPINEKAAEVFDKLD